MQDLRPKFPLPPAWLEEYALLERNKFQVASNDYPFADSNIDHPWIPRTLSQVAITVIYHDLTRLVQNAIWDLKDPETDEEALEPPVWVDVTIHRLLCFRPMEITVDDECDSVSSVAESFRLAILLYMAPIWRYYGCHPTYTQVLVQKQYALLKSLSRDPGWYDAWRQLYLFILCMSAFEAETVEDPRVRWFLSKPSQPTRIRAQMRLLPRKVSCGFLDSSITGQSRCTAMLNGSGSAELRAVSLVDYRSKGYEF